MHRWGGAGGVDGGFGGEEGGEGGGGVDGGCGGGGAGPAIRAATRSGQGEASQPVCTVTPSYSRHEPQGIASHKAS